MSTINSDEHDAEHGVRSGPGQPLAPEQCDKPGASSYQQETVESKGGDVKRAGASARTSEHDRPIFISLDQLKEDRRPAPHASCTFGALAHATRTGSLVRG